jgi:Tfp pilus assembly protein PilO
MKARNILIIVLVVVLLAVYSIIITDYLKQHNENTKLKTQVVDTTSALALIPQPPADLEYRLAAAQKNLDAVKKPFVIDTNDTQIINNILELAKEQGVKAIPLGTQPWVLENVLDQAYSVFRVDMAVTGDYQHLVNFLNKLETSQPETLVIESFSVETTSGSSLLDASARNAQILNASIKIAIYASPMETV